MLIQVNAHTGCSIFAIDAAFELRNIDFRKESAKNPENIEGSKKNCNYALGSTVFLDIVGLLVPGGLQWLEVHTATK